MTRKPPLSSHFRLNLMIPVRRTTPCEMRVKVNARNIFFNFLFVEKETESLSALSRVLYKNRFFYYPLSRAHINV